MSGITNIKIICRNCGQVPGVCRCETESLAELREALGEAREQLHDKDTIAERTFKNLMECRGQLAAANQKIEELELICDSNGWEILAVKSELAAIRPAFAKLLEYAKAEQAWEPTPCEFLQAFRRLDELAEQRREALALAEQLEAGK